MKIDDIFKRQLKSAPAGKPGNLQEGAPDSSTANQAACSGKDTAPDNDRDVQKVGHMAVASTA